MAEGLAKSTLTIIQNRLKAPKNQFNNFGKYYYRSCEDILEALKPILSEYNAVLTISDDIISVGNRFYVRATATINIEDEGQTSVTAWAREEDDKKGMDAAQITGSCSSYARKYALNGLFLIDDTKDADTMDNTKEPIQKENKPNFTPQVETTKEEPKKEQQKPVKDHTELQKEIGSWLCQMEGGIVAAETKLEALTTWTDKDGKIVPGKKSVFDLGVKVNSKGQTQTSVTHAKVKKLYEEWKQQQGDADADTN